MLATPRRLRVGRLGQMRLELGRLDLLHHIAPTSAALHRHRHRPPLGPARHVVAQPAPEPLPIRLPDPAPPLLARVDLERIERDLPSMQIQPTYDRHQGPPCSSTDLWQTKWLSAHETRRSSHIECLGAVLGQIAGGGALRWRPNSASRGVIRTLWSSRSTAVVPAGV